MPWGHVNDDHAPSAHGVLPAQLFLPPHWGKLVMTWAEAAVAVVFLFWWLWVRFFLAGLVSDFFLGGSHQAAHVQNKWEHKKQQ